MTILQLPQPTFGEYGLAPVNKKMVSTDNLATVSTAGYLNAQNLQGFSVSPTDILQITYNANAQTLEGDTATFSVEVAGGVITLVPQQSQGNVILPVVSGDFAVFSGTTGVLGDSGYSPSDATKTKVAMLGVTPVTSANLVSFSASNGTLGDSTIPVSSVVVMSDVLAGISPNIAGTGTGAGPYVINLPGATANSNFVACVQNSSNPVSIVSCVIVSANTGNITFSASPGATVQVSYFCWLP